jgi:hypothetical protein
MFQKSSRWLQGYTNAIQDSKAYTSNRKQRKQVVAAKLSRIQGGIGYLHSCSRLKCIGESMFMRWCTRDA